MNKKTLIIFLFLRLASFAFFQAITYLIFLAAGRQEPWNAAERYWIINGLLTNIITFFLLRHFFRKDNRTYFENFRFTKEGWRIDLLIAVVILICSVPISTVPNILLGNLLFGSAGIPANLQFRQIPMWTVAVGFIWALTQGLVELPFYFAFLMKKIEEKFHKGWFAWFIASFFLALQHIAIPLIFNLNFMLWRFGMFFFFAFFLGLCIKLRPRLFPYLMIMHAVLDISAVVMYLNT